jgi:glycosyltransferase involved in cell wall biosynthesis
MATPVIFVAGQDPLLGLSGHPSYVRAHARAAVSAGFEPHIFCISHPPGIVKTDFGLVHRVRLPSLRRLTRTSGIGLRIDLVGVDAPRLAAGIRQFIGSERGPHLIHGFGQWGCVGITLREQMRPAGAEIIPVNSVYGSWQHACAGRVRGLGNAHSLSQKAFYLAEWLWSRLVVARYEGRAYAESRLVLVNYESVRRLLRDEFGPGAEVRRLPYAAEAAFLPSRAPSPEPLPVGPLTPRDAPLIVSVSRHDARKGVDVLLRALGQLKAAGIPFRACLVSGGPLLTAHRRLVERLGLETMVTLTGWVPDSFAYLQHADVFVLPSLRESSGSLALLEALQAGVAVVASNVDGIPEDVTDGESALLVEPGNVGQLTGALTRVLTDRELRRRLAERARTTLVERFSADAFTAALRNLYAELGFTPQP